MDAAPHYEYPNIVPCLVFPFDRFRVHEGQREPLLVFAQRGRVVLFAIESTREFGVGMLNGADVIHDWDSYPGLDLAAREFLSRPALVQ
jgi:hypothetical protein